MKSRFFLFTCALILMLGCQSEIKEDASEEDIFQKITTNINAPYHGINVVHRLMYLIDNVVVDSLSYAIAIQEGTIQYAWLDILDSPNEIVDTISFQGHSIPRWYLNMSINGISKEAFSENLIQLDNIDVRINHLGLIDIAINHPVDNTTFMNYGIYNKETGKRILGLKEKEFTGKYFNSSLREGLDSTTQVRAVVMIGDKIGYEDFTLLQKTENPGTIESTVHSNLINSPE